MSIRPHTPFRFELTAKQAQDIFNICACMFDERQLCADIWPKAKRRAQLRSAVRRFNRQLNRQYHETGVEV